MLIGSARVSKADGSQSLDLQRDALRAAGVDAGHVYHDFASGVRDDRPGLDSCVRALRTGDVLVVWKLDRLGRNLAHLVNTVQDLSARGVGLRVLTGQGAQIDTTTAAGRLVFGIFAALAEFERELDSTTQRRCAAGCGERCSPAGARESNPSTVEGREEHQLRPGDEVEQPIHLNSQASSTAEQYAQVGNAVPVRLGRVAGTVLARDLDALREQSWQPYVRRPPAYRIVYVQSHVRTRQWFKGGETFAWRDGETNGHAVYAAPKTRRKSRALTIPARQARAFRVIDNRTSEMTSWDTDLLPDALSGLNDLDIFSFDDVLPLAATAGKTDPDDIPETPKNPVSRVGDIWTLGKHRLMCGDATKPEHVERLLDGAKPDLMVTDPPYGVNYDSSWRYKAGIAPRMARSASRPTTTRMTGRPRMRSSQARSPTSG